MGKRGRPPEGVDLVEHLEGSEVARQRLKVILQTLAGVFTVREACGVLGVTRSAFYKLRARFLADAAGALEPRPAGRRKHVPSPAEAEAERLRRENAQLRVDLKAQQIREEIALLMPHLLRGREPGKKTSRGAARGRTRSDSGGSLS
jgi:transposase-like protein